MKWTRIVVLIVSTCGLVSIGERAWAQEQPWLQDRRYREGIGYRVGDLELHPGVSGEFGYDSNMFLRDSSERVIDVYRIRITPSLSLSTLGTQRRGNDRQETAPKVSFRANAAAVYNEYIAVDPAHRDETTPFRNVGAVTNLDLHILPERPWGGRFFGDLTRTIQPSNLSDTSAAYNRINADAGGELIWSPGGGLFDWRWGYRFDITHFEEDRFQRLNSDLHTLNTRGRWRFFPRTALMFDAEQSFLRFTDRGNASALSDANPIRARIGINGLVTPHLGILAMGGWGGTFFQQSAVPVQDFDGPIGQFQLTYYPSPAPGLLDSPREASLTLSQIALGYSRNFSYSYFGGYYSQDRGYATVSYFFAGRVLVSAEGAVSRVHFPTLYLANAGGDPIVRSEPFNDMRYEAALFSEYRMIETVGLNTTLSYTQNVSKSLPTDPVNEPGVLDSLSWKRFQAYLGVRWFM